MFDFNIQMIRGAMERTWAYELLSTGLEARVGQFLAMCPWVDN